MPIRIAGHIADHRRTPIPAPVQEAIIAAHLLIIQDHIPHQIQEVPGLTAHLPIQAAAPDHTVHLPIPVVRDPTAYLLPLVLLAEGGNQKDI